MTFHKTLQIATIVGLLTAATAQANVVSAFDATFVGNGRWYNADTRPGGNATIEALSGATAVGAPLPSGAAKLTTTSSASKAEVGVRDTYGRAADILSSFNVHYSYYKVAGGDAAPAPSLKLSFVNPSVTGSGSNRGFITLIWEAYVQPYPTFTNPATDIWTDVDISFTNGRFWGTNGFGNASSFGGAPYRTLQEWLSTLGSSGFADAGLVEVGVGVGSNNVNQVAYFDDVRISHKAGDGYSAAYNFEAAAGNTVPEPTSLALVGLSLTALLLLRRRV